MLSAFVVVSWKSVTSIPTVVGSDPRRHAWSHQTDMSESKEKDNDDWGLYLSEDRHVNL